MTTLPTTRQLEYAEYLKTNVWQQLRQSRFDLDKNECVLCGSKAEIVHHRRYPDVFGMETINDLVSLCSRCHNNFHSPPDIAILQKQMMEKAMEKGPGTKCPCCKTKIKVYKRKFNSGMARCLIKMFNLSKDLLPHEWLHLSKKSMGKQLYLDMHHGEYPKMKYWGLLEQKPKEKGSTNSSGFWKLTPKGMNFVSGNEKINSHILLMKDNLCGFSDEFIDIKEALSDHFNYDELMSEALGKQATLNL